MKDRSNPSPGDLRANDTVYLYRYDYGGDPVFQREVAIAWRTRPNYDGVDLLCIDGPPGASFNGTPPSTWLTNWSPFFQPGSYMEVADMISTALYFRRQGNNGWGDSLDDRIDRARSWRDAIEVKFPEYATLPKYLWIAHREGGSGSDKEWLHELVNDLPLANPPPGPEWFVEMTRASIQELGVNIVAYGLEEDSRDYDMAFHDYVVPALQAVSAAQAARDHPKPIVDPPDQNTGLYNDVIAIYWAARAKGHELRDLSGNEHTLRRVDRAPLDVHNGAYIRPEIGMNGPALRFERFDPLDGEPPHGDFVADGAHENEEALPNTALVGEDGLTLSWIFIAQQPVINANEGVLGSSNLANTEPSISIYINPPVVEPYTLPKLIVHISFIDAGAQDVLLETDLLDYGEPAHYMLTIQMDPLALDGIATKLYRRRVGEPDGLLIASSSAEIDFSVAGSTESYFNLGNIPPASAVSNCEIEQCVIWGRVLSDIEREQMFDDPYHIEP